MTDERAEAVVSLADTAMMMSSASSSEAAVMLLDAAISIALTRFGTGASEIAGYLAEYVVQQVAYVTGENARA